MLKGVLTWQDCLKECKERIHLKNCEYFTFHPKWCRLFSNYRINGRDNRLVSGPRSCGSLKSERISGLNNKSIQFLDVQALQDKVFSHQRTISKFSRIFVVFLNLLGMIDCKSISGAGFC